MSAVTCKNLCRTFYQGDSAIHALDDVDISIDTGEFICLSGPSGSGKTTLLNAIGGLDKPNSGSVVIGDTHVEELSKNALAEMRLHNIGFIFQAYNLIPVLSARENVEFVMQVQGVEAKDRKDKAMAVLKEVGLDGMTERLPSQLSGGQQQRVAVARAIVSKPQLILADEPTANLDSKTSAHLMELFLTLNDKHKITFIISTHDQLVMSYTKRLIKMVDGKIVSDEQQPPRTHSAIA